MGRIPDINIVIACIQRRNNGDYESSLGSDSTDILSFTSYVSKQFSFYSIWICGTFCCRSARKVNCGGRSKREVVLWDWRLVFVARIVGSHSDVIQYKNFDTLYGDWFKWWYNRLNGDLGNKLTNWKCCRLMTIEKSMLIDYLKWLVDDESGFYLDLDFGCNELFGVLYSYWEENVNGGWQS